MSSTSLINTFIFSSSFLHIWNIVTMFQYPSLLILTSMSVLGWFWLLDFFSSLWVMFSCSFACLVVSFDWTDDRHCKFYFGRCWIFLYYYKYSWDVFWETVNVLKTSVILLGLLSFVRWDQRKIYLGFIISYLQGTTRLNYLDNAP